MTRRTPLRTLAAAGVLAAVLAGPLSATGLAAPSRTTFGTPSAIAAWGVGVTFRQAVTFATAPMRVEIIVSASDPGAADERAVFVSEEPVVGAGSSTLSYTVSGEAGALMPNTPVTGRWRVTYPDGTVDLGPSSSATYADTRFAWKTTSGRAEGGPQVRVHWITGDAAFGAQALAIGTGAIERISALLGVRDTRPVDFFIYADQGSFYDALGPGTRENVGGQANPEIRTLFALILPGEIGASWVSNVITHELAHLVFDGAVANPYRYPPSWVNEGLAVYLAQGYDSGDRDLVRRAVRASSLMPLEALAGQFPTAGDRFALAYAESVSAIDYLVRTKGKAALVSLVKAYRDGVSDDQAFARALGEPVGDFEAAWLDGLGAAPPVRYGPVDALPGPLPSGWSGPAATPLAAGAAGAGADASAGQGSGGGAGASAAASAGSARDPDGDDAGTGDGGLVVGLAIAVLLASVAGIVVARRRAAGGTTS